MLEIQESEFIKLFKEDSKRATTSFSSPITVVSAVENWKKKIVTFVSPKSGRILKKDKHNRDANRNSKENESPNLLSRLFPDFRKAKISDFEYQQSNVRRDSCYKPFWATKVVQPLDSSNVEDRTTKKAVNLVETTQVPHRASKLVFGRSNSPKVILSSCVESSSKNRLSSVEESDLYKLKLPNFYNGSQMYMPTGQRLFWVCVFVKLFEH